MRGGPVDHPFTELVDAHRAGITAGAAWITVPSPRGAARSRLTMRRMCATRIPWTVLWSTHAARIPRLITWCKPS